MNKTLTTLGAVAILGIGGIVAVNLISPQPIVRTITSHYYLAQWEWATSDGISYWRAPGGDSVGAIDLRTIPQMGKPIIAEGYGIFVYSSLKTIPGGVYLGTDLNTPLKIKDKDDLKLVTGISDMTSITTLDFIWDMLNKYSDPEGLTGAKPLLQDIDGNKNLYLGGVKIKSEKTK